MDFIKALIGTPAPTLLMIGGLLFLLLGLVTFKKPIVIEVTPANRKIALILGIILICAGIFLLSLQIPEQSPDTSITATPTIETPTPVTASPQSTFLITDTPLPTSVSFFENDCINSDIWTPTPLSKSRKIAGNCWDLSDNGFKVADGKLFIAIKNDPPVSGTISMSAPQTGSIKFDVKIDNFTAGESNNFAFGIGTSEGWLTTGEFIFYRPTASKIYVVQGTSVVEYGRNTINNYKLGSTDTFEFQFNKLSFDIYLNGAKVASGLTLPDAPIFWIGYRLAESSKMTTVISNFSVQK
jgi:hypothetical protein